MSIEKIILNALQEDVGDGDHSSILTIPPNIIGSSQLIVKERQK